MKFDQLGNHLRSISKKIDDEFLKQEIGPYLQAYFQQRFDFQKTPDNDVWKSDAEQTKYAGRFSITYNIRPSGNEVTNASKRWYDTGGIKESIVASYKKWTVIIKSSSKLFKYMNNTVFDNSEYLVKEVSKKLERFMKKTLDFIGI